MQSGAGHRVAKCCADAGSNKKKKKKKEKKIFCVQLMNDGELIIKK